MNVIPLTEVAQMDVRKVQQVLTVTPLAMIITMVTTVKINVAPDVILKKDVTNSLGTVWEDVKPGGRDRNVMSNVMEEGTDLIALNFVVTA